MSGSLGETMAVIGSIDPQDIGSTDTGTVWASMANFARVTGIGLHGAIDTICTWTLQQATTSGGAGAKTLAIATATAADEDNGQVVISADISDMDLAGGFTHVRLLADLTAGTANLISAVLLGFEARYAPVSGLDEASVAEIVEA